MNRINLIACLLGAAALASLAGCGSDNREPGAATTEAFKASAACIACHADNKTSPVTGARVVDEWKAGAHNTSNGASCPDCHKPAGHPNGGSITAHPDDTVCRECHITPAATDLTARLRAHFVNYTVAYTRGVPAVKTSPTTASVDKYATASYVSAEDPQSCRVCHNPHDNSSVMRANRDWAQSGHGDTEALPFVKYRFKEAFDSGAGSGECRRCHTSTGFIYYVSNNKTLIPSASFNNRKQNEVIGCKTCHLDYSWKRRGLAAVTVTYANTGATSTDTVSYPDAGESNICLNCHVGRESGSVIRNLPASTNFASKGFENSHYLTAGGTLFGKTGYTNFSGVEGRRNRNYTLVDFNGDGITDFKHDLVGRSAAGTRVGKGPCVECHMTNSSNHRFLPITEDASGKVTAVISSVCVTCHTAGSPFELTTALVNGEKDQLADALAALKAQLQLRGFYFFEKNPYFFDAAGTTATTNWVTAGDTSANGRFSGEQNMGAAFNYNLLKHDPGAYAHNRFYTKRLIYDAIDWLDDLTMNYSVGTTLNGLPADASYKANAIAYLLVNGTPTSSPTERP